MRPVAFRALDEHNKWHVCSDEQEAIDIAEDREYQGLYPRGSAAIASIESALSDALNAHLCEMKPGYDDSIVGFNEAWDVMRKVLQREKP